MASKVQNNNFIQGLLRYFNSISTDEDPVALQNKSFPQIARRYVTALESGNSSASGLYQSTHSQPVRVTFFSFH